MPSRAGLRTSCGLSCGTGWCALKITLFGLTLSSSWGNGHATPYRAILRALHRLGHRVTFYERDVPYYARHRDFTQCALLRAEAVLLLGRDPQPRRWPKPPSPTLS